MNPTAACPDPWNTLEVVKLIVASATPIAVALIGFWLARVMKRIDLSQWRNQKVIEKRMQVYDFAAPKLNALFCYFTYVGTWKDPTPHDIIKYKRELDAHVFVHQWLFSPEFIADYRSFITKCFETYQGIGRDARLRTKSEKRKVLANWKEEWKELFKEDSVDEKEVVNNSYAALMWRFAAELGSPGELKRD
jgi:hypothetical protein